MHEFYSNLTIVPEWCIQNDEKLKFFKEIYRYKLLRSDIYHPFIYFFFCW